MRVHRCVHASGQSTVWYLTKGPASREGTAWAQAGCRHCGPRRDVPARQGCPCHCLRFSLSLAMAALRGSGLVFSQGLWATFFGHYRGEVIWGGWLGALWSQPHLSSRPSTLTLADRKRKNVSSSLPVLIKAWRTNPDCCLLINVYKAPKSQA